MWVFVICEHPGQRTGEVEAEQIRIVSLPLTQHASSTYYSNGRVVGT